MLGLELGMVKREKSLREHFFANSRKVDIIDVESLASRTCRLYDLHVPSQAEIAQGI